MKCIKACLRYEGTSTMDNLNCKTQAHVRVCEENKELQEKLTAHERILLKG